MYYLVITDLLLLPLTVCSVQSEDVYRDYHKFAPDLKVVDEHGHSVHDRYYKTGSTIELTCRVMTYNEHTTTPQVAWSKDGVNLPDKVIISHMREAGGGTTVSRLVIPKAAKSDSGIYSCSLSRHSSVLVHVHILNGEKQAAVQHDTWGSTASHTTAGQQLAALLFVLVVVLKMYH